MKKIAKAVVKNLKQCRKQENATEIETDTSDCLDQHKAAVKHAKTNVSSTSTRTRQIFDLLPSLPKNISDAHWNPGT